MLLNLHIKNMALIDEIDINFNENLNILTGETGAGKSIVIDSIMLALGGRAPKDFVRQDAEYGLVELLFSVEDEETRKRLLELEVPGIDDGELVLSRKVMGARSISKLNGETVTLARVREIAALMLDLHAQHEHQSLLNAANHLKLLDRYGHEKIDPLKEKVKEAYIKYSKLKEELNANTMDEEEKKRQLDLIDFERREIEEAKLKNDEDLDLEKRYAKASNSKNIAEKLSSAYRYTEETAYEAIDRAIRELTEVSGYDEELSAMADMLAAVSDILNDFGRNARDYMENNTFSDQEFAQIESRLNTVNHLKAKYGSTISKVLAYGAELEQRYDNLLNQEQQKEQIRIELQNQEKELAAACEELSVERKRTAGELSQNITDALIDLNFLDVRFEMVFEKLEHYTKDGTDYPYFNISTNVGEEMKPLWKVASGGELSRCMLAVKSCMAKAEKT
ncbi:MAG: AAA family ATPase, partial [Lachnospiraceae bacterium]|nr:AAA family ATPase [Lachnospiraceae bacterium]